MVESLIDKVKPYIEWAHELRVLDLRLGMEKTRVEEKPGIVNSVEELEAQLLAHLELVKLVKK
jgi:hypothetical protein